VDDDSAGISPVVEEASGIQIPLVVRDKLRIQIDDMQKDKLNLMQSMKLTRDLRKLQRQRSRLRVKAYKLSTTNLWDVYCIRMSGNSKVKGASSSDQPTTTTDEKAAAASAPATDPFNLDGPE
jgi:hypothetical protein